MTRRVARWGSGLLVGALAVGLAGCGGNAASDQAAAVPVQLRADVPGNLKIGVLLTLASDPGQGVEWSEAAEGAQVAVHRFALGGAKVALEAVNDKGTAKGAAAGVRQLVHDGVAGIVVATDGSHVDGAVAAARASGVPLLLPYDADADGIAGRVWLTGPSRGEVDRAMAAELAGRHRTFLFLAGGQAPAGVSAQATRTLAPGDDATPVARVLAKRLRKGAHFDSVVVSGPAALQAEIVQALQGLGVDLPVHLTPDALSPAFAESLQASGGSLSDDLTTVGQPDGDAGALRPTAAGRALAGYFAALRQLAEDAGAQDLLGERSFAEVAGTADVRAHDAVVALVRAAAKAGSTHPADVAKALAQLRLTEDDGLAAGDLDFTSPVAVAASDVVPLQATPEDPGLRPAPTQSADAAGRLYWFRLPKG